jgi:hypothetical protein
VEERHRRRACSSTIPFLDNSIQDLTERLVSDCARHEPVRVVLQRRLLLLLALGLVHLLLIWYGDVVTDIFDADHDRAF